MVSDRMFISILSISVEPLQISCAEAVVALAAHTWDLKAEDLPSPFLLMCAFQKLILS